MEGTIFHDMSRSAVRNLVWDGVEEIRAARARIGAASVRTPLVPETVAMRLTGHRTRSVFKRYDIVDERDLLDAKEKMNARLKR